MPGLETLFRSGTLLLKHVVDATGTTLDDAGALGSVLRIQSTRTIGRVLQLWRRRLTGKERILLARYRRGTPTNPEDPFWDLHLNPQLDDKCGSLLEKAKVFSLCTGNKKTIYFNRVRVMCKRGLKNRPWCVWNSRLGGDKAAPCWRVLYKAPSPKIHLISNGGFYTVASLVMLLFLFLTPLCQRPSHSVATLKFFIVLASVNWVPHSFSTCF